VKLSEVIAALAALKDPDAEIAIGGVSHLVIEKVPAGWNGHAPATMTHRYEINSPPPVDCIAQGMARLRQQEE
jgi:hypothetical protein